MVLLFFSPASDLADENFTGRRRSNLGTAAPPPSRRGAASGGNRRCFGSSSQACNCYQGIEDERRSPNSAPDQVEGEEGETSVVEEGGNVGQDLGIGVTGRFKQALGFVAKIYILLVIMFLIYLIILSMDEGTGEENKEED